MKVTFVSSSRKPDSFRQDPSFRYRCENLCLSLRSHGVSSNMTHIESLDISIDQTHVIFHRPTFSLKLRRTLKRLKKLNIIAIADFDDLVFDPRYIEFSPAILNDIQPYNTVLKKYSSHQKALTLFEYMNVSTESLAKYALDLFPAMNVNIIHNTYFSSWLDEKKTNIIENKTITYFPGTRSHDRDFWQIEDTLDYIISKHKEVTLLTIGPVKSPLLSKPNRQIKHIAKLPFKEYSRIVGSSWVNLLPLEPTPFNQCKSALKVIEAGVYLRPTICSPIPDATRFSGCGAIFALDSNQWIDTLEALLNDQHYYKTTDNIRNLFFKRTNPHIMADEFLTRYKLE